MKKRVLQGVLPLAVLVLMAGCKKDDEINDQVIVPSPEPVEVCSTRTVEWIKDLSTQLLFGAVPNTLFLGSVIDPRGISEGLYNPVSQVQIKPVKIFTTLISAGNPFSVEIDASFENYNRALKRILDGTSPGAPNDGTNFILQPVYSEDDLRGIIGTIGTDEQFKKLIEGFKFSAREEQTPVIWKLSMRWYRVAFDIPSGGILATTLPEGLTYSPVYISAIDYGHASYILAESPSKYISGALQAVSHEILTNEPTPEIQKELLKGAKMKAYAVGTAAPVILTGYDDVLKFMSKILRADYGPNDRGDIIGFRLRDIKDYSQYEGSLKVVYDETTCQMK